MGYFKNLSIDNEEVSNSDEDVIKFLGIKSSPVVKISIHTIDGEKVIIIGEDSYVTLKYIKEVDQEFKLVTLECRISKIQWSHRINSEPIPEGIYIDMSTDKKTSVEYVDILSIRDISY